MTSVDHSLLVEAARRGDREAFGELYRHYGRMVHGILLSRVPRGEVDDLVQDAFLQALRRLDTLRDPRAFGGWLAMLTRHLAQDRSRARREHAEVDDSFAAPESTHAEALAVMRLLRGLPEAFREPLVLRLIEGLSGPEIAEMTGMTPGSVRVNLHRGMSLLRERMGVERRDV